MLKNEIRTILMKRKATNDEWASGVQQCWEEEIAVLSRDINDTISFFINDCSADEFSWLSEVFEDVAEKTQSRAFVRCLYHVADKYQSECEKYHINRVIQYAEGALRES